MSGPPPPDPARVASLFEAAIDLAPDDAGRLLDRECAGDPALRRAVERLLAHDRAADAAFLAPPVAALHEALEEERRDREPPGRLGHFFVLRQLGEGGMGAVYLGYDEALDRRVALKLLHRRAAAGEWLRQEGRALGRLAHPHVVAVHEIGEHEGRVFLAMELVEGPSLGAWLAERPRAFEEVVGLLLQAARGLAAVHDAGLVHRDFKPDNVLLGKDGRARVADFGIAVEGGGDAGAVLAGTPAYMAPEQRRGERATAASDQFAFAITLRRALSRVVDVPAWMDPILQRALSADPAARFPSMGALIEAVERQLPRDPDADPGPVRREQRIIAGVVLLLAVLITASVLGFEVLGSEWALVRLAALTTLVIAAVIALLWRRLSRNLFGRRVAALFVGAGLALLAHRLVAVRLQTPTLHVLAVDHLVLAAIFASAAVTLERSAGWSALVALAGAAVSAAHPPLAPLSFGILTVFAPALPLWLLLRRR